MKYGYLGGEGGLLSMTQRALTDFGEWEKKVSYPAYACVCVCIVALHPW